MIPLGVSVVLWKAVPEGCFRSTSHVTGKIVPSKSDQRAPVGGISESPLHAWARVNGRDRKPRNR